ncbi:MAG: apolipoprotein N-acyltransferase [bacterium JZ-2024 1]
MLYAQSAEKIIKLSLLRLFLLFICSSSASLLLYFSYPPYPFFYLVFIALIPFFWMLISFSFYEVLFGGFWFSFLFHLLLLRWVNTFGVFPWFILSFAEGVGSSLFWLWLRHLGGGSSLRIAVFAPPLWVFYEYFRTLGDIGFNWTCLAYATSTWLPFIQISSWVGIYGCIFIIVSFNASLFLLLHMTFSLLSQKRLSLPLHPTRWHLGYSLMGFVLFCANYLYGLQKVNQEYSGAEVRIAVAQLKYPSSLQFFEGEIQKWAEEYKRIVEQAKAEDVELLVLPESFLELPDYENSDIEKLLKEWLRGTRMSVLYGAAWSVINEKGEITPVFVSYHLMDGKKRRGRVDKSRLVPFGEYVPLRPLLSRIFPYPWGKQDFQRGKARKPLWWKNHRLGVLICFETLFPQDARYWAVRGAEILLSGTNSSWFGSSHATEQMAKFEVFRAVETGLYFLRAGTGGISSIIHPSGKILAWIPQFTTGMEVRDVHFLPSHTAYTLLGDWLPWLCLSFFLPFYLEVLRSSRG